MPIDSKANPVGKPDGLFTRAELASALALLTRQSFAEQLADEWFEAFVEDEYVDASGRYIFHDLFEGQAELLAQQGQEVVAEGHDAAAENEMVYIPAPAGA